MTVNLLDSSPLLNWLYRHTRQSGSHLGVDLGGAHIKLCRIDTDQNPVTTTACSVPFALWRQPEQLAPLLEEQFQKMGTCRTCSVTMTGEIADCFENKLMGVARLVQATQHAARNCPWTPSFYFTQQPEYDQRIDKPAFVDQPDVPSDYLALAASNWHAFANLVRLSHGIDRRSAGLVLDLGSTTFDLTPVQPDSSPEPATDWQRIQQGRLIYTGVGRSPLACLLPIYRDADYPAGIVLAQELFANATDVALLLEDLPVDAADPETADQRPATRPFAQQRIARLLCSDPAELPPQLPEKIATQARQNQMSLLSQAIARQFAETPSLRWVICCGQGEPLLAGLIAEQYPDRDCLRASRWLPPGISEIAPAFAVAALRALLRNN